MSLSRMYCARSSQRNERKLYKAKRPIRSEMPADRAAHEPTNQKTIKAIGAALLLCGKLAHPAKMIGVAWSRKRL